MLKPLYSNLQADEEDSFCFLLATCYFLKSLGVTDLDEIFVSGWLDIRTTT